MAAVVAELAKITEEHPYLPLACGCRFSVSVGFFWQKAERWRWILAFGVFSFFWKTCRVVVSSCFLFILQNRVNWGKMDQILSELATINQSSH